MTTFAIKLNAAIVRTANAAPYPARRILTWDLAGVLALMASSAAYALFTLSHLT